MKLSLRSDQFQKILLGVLIFSLFFPIRKVVLTNFSHVTGQFSDFTTFSLYLSDILILIIGVYSYFYDRKAILDRRYLNAVLTIVLITILLNLSQILPFNLYFLAKIIELYILYESIRRLLTPALGKFSIKLFVWLASIQVLIATAQFYLQRSLGLGLLHESVLSRTLPGVAKLVVHGEIFIRGYGTFPHPNLLAAFLFSSIFFAGYLAKSEAVIWRKVLYLSAIILLAFGLFLTFSRAALLTLPIGLLIFFFCLFWKKVFDKSWFPILGALIFSAALSILILRPYLATRGTISDEAVAARTFYNKIGLEMIKARPLQGFGPGTSLLHMEQFAPRPMKTWEIQPIHNYYLLAATELGIVGAAALIYILLSHLWRLYKKFLRERGSENKIYQALLISIFAGFLVLMLFDHYFYTLQQGQILLWLVLGLMGAELSKE